MLDKVSWFIKAVGTALVAVSLILGVVVVVVGLSACITSLLLGVSAAAILAVPGLILTSLARIINPEPVTRSGFLELIQNALNNIHPPAPGTSGTPESHD